MGKTIATFKSNDDMGIEARVKIGAHGFHVTLRDVDADMVLPCSECFQDKDEAITYAKSCVSDTVAPGSYIII